MPNKKEIVVFEISRSIPGSWRGGYREYEIIASIVLPFRFNIKYIGIFVVQASATRIENLGVYLL